MPDPVVYSVAIPGRPLTEEEAARLVLSATVTAAAMAAACVVKLSEPRSASATAMAFPLSPVSHAADGTETISLTVPAGPLDVFDALLLLGLVGVALTQITVLVKAKTQQPRLT